jgi:peptidoglycan/LPS O-acetylase OafA/YrhL
MAALFYIKKEKFTIITKFLSSKLFFIVSLFLAQVFLFFSDAIDSLLYPSVIGLMCGLIIVSYISSHKNSNGKIAKLFSYLGSISFSLYLLHSFVKDAIDGVGLGPYFAVTLNSAVNLSSIELSLLMTIFLYLPLIILFSSLTFTTIEKPFLKMRVKYLIDAKNNENIVELITTDQVINTTKSDK